MGTIGLEFSIEVLRAVSDGLNVGHASESIIIVFVLISNSYGIFAKLQISLRDEYKLSINCGRHFCQINTHIVYGIAKAIDWQHKGNPV